MPPPWTLTSSCVRSPNGDRMTAARDRRHSGIAEYDPPNADATKGLFLSAGWLKGIGAAGVAGTALVGMIMWLAARPPRDEVDKRLDSVRSEFRQEIQTLRAEIRQDIQDMRVELRKLLRSSTKEK